MALYTRGLRESFKKACKTQGTQAHFRGNNTIHTLLVAPEDKDNTTQKSGVIYHFKFTQVDCEEEYIRESGRTGDRLKEHLRAPSPIY